METNEILDQRDWSSLPLEILNAIAKSLGEIHDFVRFRAVCTAWRSSAPVTDLPLQFPWILESQDHSCRSEVRYNSDRRFYSVKSGKTYTIHAPKASDKKLLGPSDGYLLTILDHPSKKLSLLNPLNNHEILLPTEYWNNGPGWLGSWQNQMSSYVVCSGSSDRRTRKVVYCRPGDNKWCEYKLKSDYKNCMNMYLSDMLFCIDHFTGVTKVIDMASGSVVYSMPPIDSRLEQRNQYIVEAPGDILRVVRYCKCLDYLLFDTFDIYRLNLNGSSNSPCWVKVNSIGDHALFIDMGGALVLRANNNAGIRSNCIYFVRRISIDVNRRPSHEVELIDIKTDSREHFPCPLEEPECWFVPNLSCFPTQ